jgi:hypothetical protein
LVSLSALLPTEQFFQSALRAEQEATAMVLVTARATAELCRTLADNFARSHQSVRLRLDQAGGLGMTIDVPHMGDSIIPRDNFPVLTVDRRLATRLAQRVLDFPPPTATTAGFTLRWRGPTPDEAR